MLRTAKIYWRRARTGETKPPYLCHTARRDFSVLRSAMMYLRRTCAGKKTYSPEKEKMADGVRRQQNGFTLICCKVAWACKNW